MNVSLLTLAFVLPAALVGVWLHEVTHLLIGKLAGGEPFIDRWGFLQLYPSRIDFETPGKMSPLMVRMTGGTVLLYPLLALITGALICVLGINELLLIFFLFVGASGISWLDLLGLYEPKKWKRYTAGETISRSEI